MAIKIQNSNHPLFPPSKTQNCEIRYLYDMRDVLYEKEWLKTAKNFPVYYVWRGIKEKNGLRYDITIIPPKMLGEEFPKTSGHKHLRNFKELLNVLEGEAYYLYQKGKANKIDEVKVVKAKKGDWIIYPPRCTHLTINPGKKRLVFVNWISKNCKSDYSLFEKYQGACYYYTTSGWIKNKNYKKVPKLIFKKPLKKSFKRLEFLPW